MPINRISSVIPMLATAFVALLLISCAGEQEQPAEAETESQATSTFNFENIQDTTDVVARATGLSGPESVRYDPGQDVYFVANFNGPGGERDANGFISKVGPDGAVQDLEFMTGTESAPMHAPRGMYITGDTLWVADADGVHGFNRTTGEHVTFVDFTSLEPGFLNDVAEGPDGALYVTDTGQSRLYKIENGEASVVQDDLPHAPNGITVDESSGLLLLCPWGGARTFYGWNPATTTLEEVRELDSGGDFDGIELVNGSWVVSSQVDSTIKVDGQTIIRTPGDPADIGIDTQRMRVAVPYIALNKVEIWALPIE
ncbi:SMP-30/gluconolactonase/LRE family protein [Halalkalibaculum sp. DA3122]|uniref:SMP-30/gluconolactonase/LRE family protein n=1 Tax=unclassified Halalkalibaculum TaxID=2964617 RepID=UPI0037540AEE